jgi:peptide/nickel transport system substrate-binding protein
LATRNGANRLSYDKTKLEPQLAESWTVAPEGLSVTFKLRPDATFHDGTPITAKDVKWSLDRAIAAGGFAAIQMGAGSMTNPEQFVVIDDHTIRIEFPKANKLSLPDLAVPVPVIINSELAKKHATSADPWAFEWVGRNDAGGGPYKVDTWSPGSELVLTRFDGWKSGPPPAIERAVMRVVPSAGTRRALLERGDADISFNLPPKDFSDLKSEGKLKVVGTPVESDLVYLDMNVTKKPFTDLKVRQAVALAIPYDQIFKNAFYGRAVPMWGAKSSTPEEATWPVPSPFSQDLDKAKKLLAEAGLASGFSTTLSFDLSQATIYEPTAVLIKESLAKIGIDATIDKVPGANWYANLNKKEMPMLLMGFQAWLAYPEYWFYWNYDGVNNSVFNSMVYKNSDVDTLINAARFEADPTKYANEIKEMITKVFDDVPRVPLVDQI